MNPPALVLQDFLPQTIAIPGRPARMVTRTITLDSEKVGSWLRWMSDRQIDKEPSDTDLRNNLESLLFQNHADGPLEVICWLGATVIRSFQNPTSSKRQVLFQDT